MIDDEIARIDENAIAEKVKDLPQPYVFGISVLTSQAVRAYELAEMLKRSGKVRADMAKKFLKEIREKK